jgi:hypothetical protein
MTCTTLHVTIYKGNYMSVTKNDTMRDIGTWRNIKTHSDPRHYKKRKVVSGLVLSYLERNLVYPSDKLSRQTELVAIANKYIFAPISNRIVGFEYVTRHGVLLWEFNVPCRQEMVAVNDVEYVAFLILSVLIVKIYVCRECFPYAVA